MLSSVYYAILDKQPKLENMKIGKEDYKIELEKTIAEALSRLRACKGKIELRHPLGR